MAAIMGVSAGDEDGDAEADSGGEAEGGNDEEGGSKGEGEGEGREGEREEGGTALAGSTDAPAGHGGEGRGGAGVASADDGVAVRWLELDEQGITDEGLEAMELQKKHPVSRLAEDTVYCGAVFVAETTEKNEWKILACRANASMSMWCIVLSCDISTAVW